MIRAWIDALPDALGRHAMSINWNEDRTLLHEHLQKLHDPLPLRLYKRAIEAEDDLRQHGMVGAQRTELSSSRICSGDSTRVPRPWVNARA